MWYINHSVGKTKLRYRSNSKDDVYKYSLETIKQFNKQTQDEFISNIDNYIRKHNFTTKINNLKIKNKKNKFNLNENQIYYINYKILSDGKLIIKLDFKSNDILEIYHYVLKEISDLSYNNQQKILNLIHSNIKKYELKEKRTYSREYKEPITVKMLAIHRSFKFKKKYHRKINKELIIEKNDKIQIFTDGSLNSLSKRAGISFCTDEHSFYKYINTYSNSSTYYELIAILYTLFFIIDMGYNDIEIITDSDEAYKYIYYQNIIYHNYIVKKIKNIIIHHNLNIKFRCIKSHQDKTSYGAIMNDKADKLAKFASFSKKSNMQRFECMFLCEWDFCYLFSLNYSLYYNLIVNNIEHIIDMELS